MLALFVGSATAQDERASFVNGANCSLKAKISCEVDIGGGETYECKKAPIFEKPLCEEGPQVWVATYTIEYSNTNSINRDIVFFKGINPESSKDNPFTFARANTQSIGIQKKLNMPRNTSRKFVATRNIDLCAERPKRKLFIAEVQVNGFMSGKRENNKFSCSARDFYRKEIQMTEALSTLAPTTANPTKSPTPMPTPGPSSEPTPSPSTASPTSAPSSAPTAAAGKGGKGGKGRSKVRYLY